MWIGFSAVEGAEAGPAVRGEAFSLESCQNWLPGEPHPATAERCVRLGPAGQCNTDLCSVPHSYVCELRPGGALGATGGARGHLVSWTRTAASLNDERSPGHPGSSSAWLSRPPPPPPPAPNHAVFPGCPRTVPSLTQAPS